jgi:protein phosphatase
LRNLLTRALGAREIGGVDTVLLDPVAGEWFLACSDGLTGELSDAEIAAVLARGGDPQEVAQSLVSAAVSAGGRDNVTAVVVLVECVEGGPDAG